MNKRRWKGGEEGEVEVVRREEGRGGERGGGRGGLGGGGGGGVVWRIKFE